jgi:hypothetical protein
LIASRWNQLPKGKVSPAIATAVGIEDGSFVMTSWRGVQTSPATFQCTYNHMFSANIVCTQQSSIKGALSAVFLLSLAVYYIFTDNHEIFSGNSRKLSLKSPNSKHKGIEPRPSSFQ